MQATITFNVQDWDEKTYAEFEGGRKLTRVLATFVYTGELRSNECVEKHLGS